MTPEDFTRLLDRASFWQIFALWIVIIFLFGLLYATGGSLFIDPAPTFLESIYFSFTTATSVGFGDFAPIGFGRFLAIMEAIVGLLMYGIVLSKLMSYKQETILEQVYSISFQERINRLRSMLQLFRSDINRIIENIHEGASKPQFIKESPIHFHTLANTLQDVDDLLHKREINSHYVKGVDFGTFELILNSIIISLDKLVEFFAVLKQYKININKIHFVTSLNHICTINQRILRDYDAIDDGRIQNKLYILESFTKKIRKEYLEEGRKKR